jgi:hypothetical protein
MQLIDQGETPGPRRGWRRFLLLSAALVILVVAVVLFLARGSREEVHALLPDGRIVCVEAVTFGRSHTVGASGWLYYYLGKVLPSSSPILNALYPARSRSHITTEEEALVVWLYVWDPNTKRATLFGGERSGFVDEHGDVYCPVEGKTCIW